MTTWRLRRHVETARVAKVAMSLSMPGLFLGIADAPGCPGVRIDDHSQARDHARSLFSSTGRNSAVAFFSSVAEIPIQSPNIADTCALGPGEINP